MASAEILLIHWPLGMTLAATAVVIAWGRRGPLGGAAAVLLAGLLFTNLALTAHQPGLAGLCWLLLVGVAVAASIGHSVLQAQERQRQAVCERAQEEAGAHQETVAHLETVDRALQARLQRYTALRAVTEALGLPVADLDTLSNTVATQALRVLDHADVALVYLVESPRQGLALQAVQWRRQAAEPIKRKTGDLFDQWVLRQGQPLLVRNARNDFRFPAEVARIGERPIGSLVAAPLISAQRVLGVLRAESGTAEAFTPEDLRLLDIVADLAAMAMENTRLYLRTAELAMTDDLTGLAVHRYFHERLEEELARARRHQHPVSLLLIDLDHFKRYNDTYGHPAGDKLLRMMAQALRRWQGDGQLVARYGGEEFVILLAGVDHERARQQAEELRATLAAQEIPLRQGATRITVSIGVATFPDDGQEKTDLLLVADQRLYRAKSGGRNQVCAG